MLGGGASFAVARIGFSGFPFPTNQETLAWWIGGPRAQDALALTRPRACPDTVGSKLLGSRHGRLNPPGKKQTTLASIFWGSR